MHVRFRTGSFDAPIEAVTCDVSFISLVKVLPSVLLFPQRRLAGRPGETQFEVGRAHIGKGGIVKNETAKAEAVIASQLYIEASGWAVRGVLPSPIAGQDGNEEILRRREPARLAERTKGNRCRLGIRTCPKPS